MPRPGLPRFKDHEPFLRALFRNRPVMAWLLMTTFLTSVFFGLATTEESGVLLATASASPVRVPLAGAAWAHGDDMTGGQRFWAVVNWPVRFILCSLLEVSIGEFLLITVMILQLGTVLEHWLGGSRLVRLIVLAFILRALWTAALLLVAFDFPARYHMRPSLAWLCLSLYIVHEVIFRWRPRTLPHMAPFYYNPQAPEAEPTPAAAPAAGTAGALPQTADGAANVSTSSSSRRRRAAAPPENVPDATPPAPAPAPAPAAPAAAGEEAAAVADPAAEQAAAAAAAIRAWRGFHDIVVGHWAVTEASWGFSQLRLFGKIPLGPETLYFMVMLPLLLRMDFWMEMVPGVLIASLALRFI